jgi:hypothetical protein
LCSKFGEVVADLFKRNRTPEPGRRRQAFNIVGHHRQRVDCGRLSNRDGRSLRRDIPIDRARASKEAKPDGTDKHNGSRNAYPA